MDEKRIINQYRELSLNLTVFRKMLKETKGDLERVKFPGLRRDVLLHEKLIIESTLNSIRFDIRRLADNMNNSIIERVIS